MVCYFSPNGLKTLPFLLGLRQSVNATLQLWDDLHEDGALFLMTSRLNTDVVENLFSVLRMHGGSYNQNPSVKAVRLALRKNIILNLNKNSGHCNCLTDDDEMLLQGDMLSPQVPSTLGNNAACSRDTSVTEEYDDIDNPDMQVLENLMESLSTSTCPLETCAVEYFAGYIAKKSTDKSRCPRCRAIFIDAGREFQRNEQTLIASGRIL